MRLKSRKAELKQQLKVSQPNMLACFTIIVDTMQDLFSRIQNQIFVEFQQIEAFQILNQGVD